MSLKTTTTGREFHSMKKEKKEMEKERERRVEVEEERKGQWKGQMWGDLSQLYLWNWHNQR